MNTSQIESMQQPAQPTQENLPVIQNSYQLQVGNTAVELRYRENAPSLQQKITAICKQSME